MAKTTTLLARQRVWWRLWWRSETGRAVAMAVGVWLGTRLCFLALTYWAVLLVPGETSEYLGGHPVVGPHDLLQHWWFWDTGIYVNLGAFDYSPQTPYTAAFFPLYPALIHLLSGLFPDGLVAGLIISNAALLAALLGLALLVRWELGPGGGARRAPVLLLCYPLSFFLTAAYADALLLACVVWALLLARRGKFGWAAFCTFLAVLARPTGVALVLPLLYEWARQAGWLDRVRGRLRGRLRAWPLEERWDQRWDQRWGWRRSLLAGGAILLAAPTALALFAWHLAVRLGDPLAFLHSQQRFYDRTTTSPWESVRFAVQQYHLLTPWTYPQARVLLDLLPLLAAAAITLLAARRLPLTFTLYQIGLLLLCVLTPEGGLIVPDPYVGVGRYLIGSVPVLLALTAWTERRPALFQSLVLGGALLQGVLVAYELQHGWLV
jgi:hypothetical protein